MAAASMNREGKVTETAAREIVTEPSSVGWPCHNLPFDLFTREFLSHSSPRCGPQPLAGTLDNFL
jgi:hypothetical protein